MTDYTPNGYFPPGYFPPEYFGGDSGGGPIVGALSGTASGSCVVTGELTNGGQTQRFTGAGSWNPNWATTYGPEKPRFVVKAKGKRPKKLKTAAAAIKAAQSAPVETFTYAGVDLVAEFRALIARLRDDEAARREMAAKLAELEMQAAREARERDDEEAVLLLLN